MATRYKSERRRKPKQEYFFDYTLLFVVLFLLGFGLIMIYSTSSYESAIKFDDASYYLVKQAQAIGLGLLGMFVMSRIPYQFWEKFAMLGYIVSAVLLLLLLSPLGIEANEATRWLGITVGGRTISFQPAEIVKVAMILFMSSLVCKMGNRIKTKKGFWIVFLAPVPVSFMVLTISKNLSTAIIIMGISVLMLFVASPDYKKFILVGTSFLTIVSIGVYAISKTVTIDSENFRLRRIIAWLNPEADPTATGYQTLQSLYAIGSGGVFGKGLGQSMQKLGYLPEAQNDMIFSIICEELGLFGGIAIIFLFILLIWRLMIIANNAKDLFGALLVVGVMGHFAIQVILNIAVVTNTIPNTGISLPFISYGGTAVLFLLLEIGLVLSVSRGIQLKE